MFSGAFSTLLQTLCYFQLMQMFHTHTTYTVCAAEQLKGESRIIFFTFSASSFFSGLE